MIKVTIKRPDGSVYSACGIAYKTIYEKLRAQHCFPVDHLTGDAINKYVVHASGKTIDDYIIYGEELDWFEYEKDEAAVMTGDSAYKEVIEYSAAGVVIWEYNSSPFQEQIDALNSLGFDINDIISSLESSRTDIWDKYFPGDLPEAEREKYDALDLAIDALNLVFPSLEESYYILQDIEY